MLILFYRYSPSGAYYLNPTGKQEGLTRVYCFMEEDETCPAGSTLVLKIDGSKVREEDRYTKKLEARSVSSYARLYSYGVLKGSTVF